MDHCKDSKKYHIFIVVVVVTIVLVLVVLVIYPEIDLINPGSSHLTNFIWNIFAWNVFSKIFIGMHYLSLQWRHAFPAKEVNNFVTSFNFKKRSTYLNRLCISLHYFLLTIFPLHTSEILRDVIYWWPQTFSLPGPSTKLAQGGVTYPHD